MKQISIAILVGWFSSIIACDAQQKAVVDGRYTLSYSLPSGEYLVVGYLVLNSGNYSFEFDKNYKKNESIKVAYPPFCITYPSGKFTSNYSAGISKATDWNKLKNHETIFHIRLYSNEKEIYRSLIRLDQVKKILYFHSGVSEIQVWSIERLNTNIDQITSVDAFVKSCQQECANSPLRYKSNISGNAEPTDQCELIRHYADMIFNGSQNALGAKLILKDVCPQAVNLVK